MVRRLFLPILATAALTGCAQNRVRLDVAGEMAAKSADTARGVSRYFDELEVRRRSTAAAMIASDPSCLPYAKLPVQLPGLETKPDPNVPLCVFTGGPKLGYDLVSLDLGPTPETILRPRALLVTAIVDYGAALAKIIADPEADIAGDLAAFAEKVDRVGSFVGLLAGSDLPTAGGVLDSKEGKAITDLAVFANMIAHEAGQVKRVRLLMREQGNVVDAALAAIDETIRVRVSGESTGLDTLYADALRRGYRRDRARMTFTDRQLLARMVLEADVEAQRAPERTRAVRDAIAETQAAQAALRNILLESREWPQERRDEAARLNLDRLTRALGLLASLGRAFV